MKRRDFLITSGAIILTGAIGGKYYLFNKNMERPQSRRDGMIIADLHTHPNKGNNLETISSFLSEDITGLTETNLSNRILTYDNAKNLSGFIEIDSGLFGRMEYNGKVGYAVKTQEIMSNHHILSLGLREKLEDYPDARKTVEEIHKRGGIAILNHPFVVPSGNWLRYRLINSKEEQRVKELCEMVDEVEVFNGQNINLIPFILDMTI
ncbi:hypothetical protein K8R47_03185, partial [archaeon]|nr:hypothetical protein [archaeon]